MRGMDAGPGTDLGGLGWFVGIWVTMMAAMMLPSVSPMVLAFARVSRSGRVEVTPRSCRRGSSSPATGGVDRYGLLAYGVFRLVEAAAGDALAWDRAGPYVAGGAILAAGLYQLTPIKDVCLRHCRTPLHFLSTGGTRGRWARCAWASCTASTASAAAGA